MVLEPGVEVLSRSVLKGNLQVGAGSRIESGVIMTGSDDHPMRVGGEVTVKGTTYLYGCRIDDGVLYMEACRRLPEYLENPRLPFFLWLRGLTGQSRWRYDEELGAPPRSAGARPIA